MLLKLDEIQEIGRFALLKHKAPQFSRLTLVFARNGYGKSTICAVLRSASESQPNYIHARRRLNAEGESRVRSNWGLGSDVVFSSGKWNSCPGKVYVFDQEFVHQNLHVGESVTRENKRSLLPVVLGDKGVELAQKIIDLDREQRDLVDAMNGYAATIRAKCPVVSTNELSSFSVEEVPQDIDQRVETASRAVELAKHSDTVKQKKNPKTIPIETLDQYREIAARTIATVSEDAANRVRAHIEDHGLEPNGDRWLKYGIDHLSGDACPFCEQPIAGLDLIAAYQAYFSEAFASLIVDRDAAIEEIRAICSEGAGGLAVLADENTTDFVFWKPVCDLPDPPTLSEEQRKTIATGLGLLDALFEKKVANPLAVISLAEHSTAIEAAFALITNYDAGMEKCVTAIEKARSDLATADLAQAENTQRKWLALKAKQTDPIKSAAASYATAEARRKAIKNEKETAQSKLKTHASATIGAWQTEINELLSDFGANFTIVDAKASFVGRDPNTDYAIAIGANKIKVGEKSDTEPSFKTVLSAGDKTSLAFAFFNSQVRADPKLAGAVVVFDDPFSSQDMHRRFETTSRIRSIVDVACQTLVFSHNPRFLWMIEKDADASITETFQLLCTDSGDGSISLWSAADELKDLYVRQCEMIREYASRGKLLQKVTEVTLIQAMRPFLEDYIRARCPGRFTDQELLFKMAEDIKQVGNTDPMFNSVTDLMSINEYTRPNHHGGGQVPDPTELRAQCKKIIRIIDAC